MTPQESKDLEAILIKQILAIIDIADLDNEPYRTNAAKGIIDLVDSRKE